MQIEDFDRFPIYKLFLPTLYLINWVLMVVGPLYYPEFYEKYYYVAVCYLTGKTCFGCLYTIIGSTKAHRLLDNFERQCSPDAKLLNGIQAESSIQPQSPEIEHLFVIPNYKQQEEVLSQTIEEIAKHPQAKQRYSIFLAMQDHEPQSESKALKLIAKHKHALKHIGYTIHTLQKYEQRGKASNVSWCVERLNNIYFQPMGIDPNRILLTIMDADSWMPHLYVQEVDKHIATHHADLHTFIYQPCQMFLRNQREVPFVVRHYDVAHGLVHFCNLHSTMGISFPLSNYSLSYTLAERIGFWDTCPEAIGQDFHTTIKAFWKTNGNITTVPVWAPFNQLSIHTGKGFWADCKSRFWQAERHARGCADVAYNLKNLIQKPVSWRTFFLAFQTFEIMCLSSYIPWCIISVNFVRLFFSDSASALEMNNFEVSWIFNICSVGASVTFIFYDILCRRASKLLYPATYYQQTLLQWLIRFVIYNNVFFICLFAITIPSLTIGMVRTVVGKNVYDAAEKKLDKKINDKEEDRLLEK